MPTRKSRVRLVTGSVTAGTEPRKEQRRTERAGVGSRHINAVEQPSSPRVSKSQRAIDPQPLSTRPLAVDKDRPYLRQRDLIDDLVALAAAGALDPVGRREALEALPPEERALAQAAFSRLEALDDGIRCGRLPAEAKWPVFVKGTALRARVVMEIIHGRAQFWRVPISQLRFTRSKR